MIHCLCLYLSSLAEVCPRLTVQESREWMAMTTQMLMESAHLSIHRCPRDAHCHQHMTHQVLLEVLRIQ